MNIGSLFQIPRTIGSLSTRGKQTHRLTVRDFSFALLIELSPLLSKALRALERLERAPLE